MKTTNEKRDQPVHGQIKIEKRKSALTFRLMDIIYGPADQAHEELK